MKTKDLQNLEDPSEDRVMNFVTCAGAVELCGVLLLKLVYNISSDQIILKLNMLKYS